jgi:hypothetical protein
MTLHRDHVAGGAFFAAGLIVLAISGDLPFGTLASPGAGMLPTLAVGLIMAFAVVLVVNGRSSPVMAAIRWPDLPHALRVLAVSAAGTALYTRLGFLLTMSLVLLSLTFAVERRPFMRALVFSVGVTILVYLLFSRLLRTPMPQGVLGF